MMCGGVIELINYVDGVAAQYKRRNSMYDENYRVEFTKDELVPKSELLLRKEIEELREVIKELRKEIEELRKS